MLIQTFHLIFLKKFYILMTIVGKVWLTICYYLVVDGIGISIIYITIIGEAHLSAEAESNLCYSVLFLLLTQYIETAAQSLAGTVY